MYITDNLENIEKYKEEKKLTFLKALIDQHCKYMDTFLYSTVS